MHSRPVGPQFQDDINEFKYIYIYINVKICTCKHIHVMYVSIYLFLIFVHLSGESLYIDSNKCAPLPSFLPYSVLHSLPSLPSSFCAVGHAGPKHHIASSRCCGACRDPNTILPARDAVGAHWPKCQTECQTE